MTDAKRGRHERRRRGLIELFQWGRNAAVRRLQSLPSIITKEPAPLGKERA